MISYEELSQVFDMDNPLTLEYFELCNRDTDEPKYFERHHILPRSVFPEFIKSSWNIVRLSYQDHYKAHEILPLICVHKRHVGKMLRAWRWINTYEGVEVDSNRYALLRTMHKNLDVSDEYRVKMSLAQRGRKHSEDTKRKISEGNIGRVVSDETKAKSAISHKGFKHSEVSKQKMSVGRTGDKNFMFGKTHSDEIKFRLSQIFTKPAEPFVEFLDKNTTYEMLENYVKMSKKTLFRCRVHDHEFRQSPSSIMYDRRGCKFCLQDLNHVNKKASIDSNLPHDIRREKFLQFLQEHTNLRLITEFKAMWEDSTFQCNRGHSSFITKPVYVKRTSKPTRCKQCAREDKHVTTNT